MNTEHNQPVNAVKRRGRPPAFNQDQALESAMQTFWTFGYEGTSMAALIEAMKMNKPSIYAAFGNKEALFNQVLDKYVSGPSAFVKEALAEPTAYLVVKKFLTQAVALLTQQDTPRGCMIVQGALSCGPEAAMMQKKLMAYRARLEEGLKQRFEIAKQQGDLPAASNIQALAKYVATLHQGISVQASSGASKEALLEMIEIALINWPMTVNHTKP